MKVDPYSLEANFNWLVPILVGVMCLLLVVLIVMTLIEKNFTAKAKTGITTLLVAALGGVVVMGVTFTNMGSRTGYEEAQYAKLVSYYGITSIGNPVRSSSDKLNPFAHPHQYIPVLNESTKEREFYQETGDKVIERKFVVRWVPEEQTLNMYEAEDGKTYTPLTPLKNENE